MIRIHELHVQVYHGCQKFNQPMRGVHQDGVHRYMPRGIITMDTTNIWYLGLQPMGFHPTQRTYAWKNISDQGPPRESFQNSSFLNTSGDSNRLHDHINKLLMAFSIQWQYIKDLVAFTISIVEGLFHFQNINFEGKADYMNQYHVVKRDVHPSLALGNHFILLQSR